MKRFAKKTVIVTGAAGGLGREYALGFAREGAALILADVNEAGLAESAKLIKAEDAPVETHRVDLGRESEIKAFAAKILKTHDRIDVLVNNAGIAYGETSRSFIELSQEAWLNFLSVNSLSPLLLAQALRPALAKAEGCVINKSSMAANMPANAYGISKALVNAMTYGMATAFSEDGIRVNAIAPGIFETEAGKHGLSPETFARIEGMQLTKRRGQPKELVSLMLFLASDEASFINNELISMDGGNRMRGWRM